MGDKIFNCKRKAERSKESTVIPTTSIAAIDGDDRFWKNLTASALLINKRISFKEAKNKDCANRKEQPFPPNQCGMGVESKSNQNEKENLPSLFSRKIIETQLMKWKVIGSVGPGLHNLGNTCFLNSVLQCLSYSVPLVNYLMEYGGDHVKSCRWSGFCLLCAMQKHIRNCFSTETAENTSSSCSFVGGKKASSFSPSSIASNLKSIGKQFRLGRQEDAHEFLRFFIDALQRSSLADLDPKLDNRIKETSFVYGIFGGRFKSSVTCHSCTHISVIYETFLDISLEIRNADSLQKAFSHFTAPERLSHDNRYRCEACKGRVEASKQILLQSLPLILTIQLKRFTVTHKINKHVSFPIQLSLKPYSVEKARTDDSCLYSLYGVLVHQGGSCNSGHYYAFVKASNGGWYLMNDSSVHQVSIDTVLKQNAYLLFYTKIPAMEFPHSSVAVGVDMKEKNTGPQAKLESRPQPKKQSECNPNEKMSLYEDENSADAFFIDESACIATGLWTVQNLSKK